MNKRKFIWALPGDFLSNKNDGPFIFDLTNYLEIFIENKLWVRKLQYGFINEDLLRRIFSVKAIIYPRDYVSMSVTQVHGSIFTKQVEAIPASLAYIYDRGNLRTANSLVFLEIELEGKGILTENFLRQDESIPENMLSYDIDFIVDYQNLISISNEFASLLLSALHLCFSTNKHDFADTPMQTSGLVSIEQDGQFYYRDQHSDIFCSTILLEQSRFGDVEYLLKKLASIWHKELWTMHRYLKALNYSAHLTIDSLLDLIFCLESLFKDGTSGEMIRLSATLITAKSKKAAIENDFILKQAMLIRNNIVHGGKSYRMLDHVGKGNNQVLVLNLFWKFKYLITLCIHFSLKSFFLLPDHLQSRLLISLDDIYDIIYKNNLD